MSMSGEMGSNTQRGCSWAKIAMEGKKHPPSNTENWPVVKLPSPPRSDTKQERINLLEDQVRRLEVEVARLKANEAAHAAEREAYSAKIIKLEDTVNDARKKILSLQPPQDISDDRVKQAFDDLCQNVEDFVDVECGGLISLEDRFNTGDWTDLELQITESHITEDDVELSKIFPKIATNIIMSAIFSLMYKYAFREDTWIALAEKRKQEEFLNDLVDIMSTCKSFYNASGVGGLQSALKFADNPQLRRWRSESFRALQNADYHVSKRTSGMREWGRKLYLMLQHFVDDDKAIKYERLRSKIIEPAYYLASMIKTSTSGYRFNFMVNSSSHNICLEAKAASMYKIVDARTGTEEEFAAETENCIGRLRLCMFPSLEKVRDDGERVCLSKAFVVIDQLSNEDSTTVVSETTVHESD